MANNPQETDRKVRKLTSEAGNPRAGQELANFQAGQNELLGITNQQQALLKEQMLSEQSQAAQNQTLQQAGEMGMMAAMGEGSQGLAQQVTRMQPGTQATLAKYGVKPAAPKVQRSSGRNVQVTPNKVTINNTTYTTIHNDTKVNAPQQAAPVVVQDGGGKGGNGQGTLAKFKTWMSNAFARQREESVIRQKEYQRKEWSLSRSASRMMRGLEKLGKTFAERLDPRKLANGKMSTMQMLSYIMTVRMIKEYWPQILDYIRSAVNWLANIGKFFGIGPGVSWDNCGLRTSILNLLGADPSQNKDIFSAIKDWFWDSDGKSGIFNYLINELKHLFNWDERVKAVSEIKLPDFPQSDNSMWGGLLNGITGALSSIGGYIKDILTALLTGKSFTTLRAARELKLEEINKGIVSNDPVSKNAPDIEGAHKGAANFNQSRKDTYIKTDNGVEKIDIAAGDTATLRHSGGARQNWLMPSDIYKGNLTNSYGASARMASFIQDSMSSSDQIDRFIAGMQTLKERAKEDSDGVVVPLEFLNKLTAIYGINPPYNYKKVKYVAVPRDEVDKYNKQMNYGERFFNDVSDVADVASRDIFNALFVAPLYATYKGLDALGDEILQNSINSYKNSTVEGTVLRAVPLSDPRPGIVDKDGKLITDNLPYLTEQDFENIESQISNAIGLGEGVDDNFETSNIDLRTGLQDYLRNTRKDTKLNQAIADEAKAANIDAIPSVLNSDAEYTRFSGGWNEDSIKLLLQSNPEVSKAYFSGVEIDTTTGQTSNKFGKNKQEYIDQLYTQFKDQISKDGKNTTLDLGNGNSLDLSYLVDTRSRNQVEQDAVNRFSEQSLENASSAKRTIEKASQDQRSKEKGDDGPSFKDTHAYKGFEYLGENVSDFFNWGKNAAMTMYGNWTGKQIPKNLGVSDQMVQNIVHEEVGKDKYFGYDMSEEDLQGKNNGDAGGHKTFGYGLLVHPSAGKYMDEVKDSYTQEELQGLFLDTIGKASKQVDDWAVKNNVTLTQAQKDAMVSGIYNFGTGFLNKDIVKKIAVNPNDESIVEDWKHLSDPQLDKYPGLKDRREMEARWYSAAPTGASTSQSASYVSGSTAVVDWVNQNVNGKHNNYNKTDTAFRKIDDNNINSVCSTSMYQAYKDSVGINIGYDTGTQIKNGSWVHGGASGVGGGVQKDGTVVDSGALPDESRLQPGDLLFYRPAEENLKDVHKGRDFNVGHVEMYIGDGKKIGTGSTKDVVPTSLTSVPKGQTYIGAKRYVDGSVQVRANSSGTSGGSFFGSTGGFFDQIASASSGFFDKIKEGFNSLANLKDAKEEEWIEIPDPIKYIKELEKNLSVKILDGNKITKQTKLSEKLSGADPDFVYKVQWQSTPGQFKLFKRKKTGKSKNLKNTVNINNDIDTKGDNTSNKIDSDVSMTSSVDEKDSLEYWKQNDWKELSKEDLKKLDKKFEKFPNFYADKEGYEAFGDKASVYNQYDKDYDYMQEYVTDENGNKILVVKRKRKKDITDEEAQDSLNKYRLQKKADELGKPGINTGIDPIPTTDLTDEDRQKVKDFEEKDKKDRVSIESIMESAQKLVRDGKISEEDYDKAYLDPKKLASLLSQHSEFNYTTENVLGPNGYDEIAFFRKPKEPEEIRNIKSRISEYEKAMKSYFGDILGIQIPDKITKTDLEKPDANTSEVSQRIVEGKEANVSKEDEDRAAYRVLHDDLTRIINGQNYQTKVIASKDNGSTNISIQKTNNISSDQQYTKP